tara:strand:+ start:728 stop:1096 length:369 start_codon:yes stop_codon:yes gene_type:complete
MNEREEQLADRFRADYEAEMDCEVIKINGLRFQYDRGELEDIEWEDVNDFLASHAEKLFEDAYAEDSREAQKILSYAWLRVRQDEAKEQDKTKPQLRAIECIHLDDDADKYLEELCDPKGGF